MEGMQTATPQYVAPQPAAAYAAPQLVAPAAVPPPAASPMQVDTPPPPLAPSSPRTSDAGDGEKPKGGGVESLLIPKAAVKRIMKLDPEVNQVANDAVILVAKATEMFLEKFSAEARAQATLRSRTTVKYEDIADTVSGDKNYEFLATVIPNGPVGRGMPLEPATANGTAAPAAPNLAARLPPPAVMPLPVAPLPLPVAPPPAQLHATPAP
ncbi:hypothetical protein JL722_7117 [Aureococcus anophagefferens]|nr:hypothetical protein JL722_7117 [Aureococcus anophagefferens]